MILRTDVPYCSSCYQAKPGQPHIDFEAAWDGPVLDAAAAAQIDDLVICADCLDGAARLLGYTRDEDRIRVEQVEAEKVALRERAQAAEAALAKARTALAEGPAKRGPGRPPKVPLPA